MYFVLVSIEQSLFATYLLHHFKLLAFCSWLSLNLSLFVLEQLQQGFFRKQRFFIGDTACPQFFAECFVAVRAVVLLAQVHQNPANGVIELLLHLLMVAAALLGLPRPHEQRHTLEYFIHAPQVLIDEMPTVHLNEPMVSLVLL